MKTLCFSSVTQHHVNQANICEQFVLLTIWCEMTVGCSSDTFPKLRCYLTAGLVLPIEELDETADMYYYSVLLLVMATSVPRCLVTGCLEWQPAFQ